MTTKLKIIRKTKTPNIGNFFLLEFFYTLKTDKPRHVDMSLILSILYRLKAKIYKFTDSTEVRPCQNALNLHGSTIKTPYGEQSVQLATPKELELFKISKHREVLIIHLNSSQNILLTSRAIIGSTNGVSCQEEIFHEVSKIRKRAIKKRLTITEISIVHSHLNKENLSQGQLRFLSATDIKTLKNLAHFFPHPLTIKAVTSSFLTYSYSVNF